MNAPQESTTRPWQRIGALGIVYAILYFIAQLALEGNGPSEKASPAKVAAYYDHHSTSLTAAVFMTAVAMVVFAFFLTALRRTLSRSGRDGGYLSIATIVGGAAYISGHLVGGLFVLAARDAGQQHADAAAQTINFINTDDWALVVAGLSITALATGIAGLRNRTLPKWLAWVSIVLGVMAIAGPVGAIAFLLTPLWTIALGIVLMRRGAHEVAGEPAVTIAV
jgi:hypothetical protein